eukprot:3612404-Prymnesium_polylepis.2
MPGLGRLGQDLIGCAHLPGHPGQPSHEHATAPRHLMHNLCAAFTSVPMRSMAICHVCYEAAASEFYQTTAIGSTLPTVGFAH